MSSKILVAHGNTQRLRQIVRDLQGTGVQIIATPDGGDAFARFFEESPQLVICSEVLPSLSGLNFARMVLSQAPEIPVVMLSQNEQLTFIEGVTVFPDPLDLAALREAFPHVLTAAAETQARQNAIDEHARVTTVNAASVFIQAALKRFQRDNTILSLLDDGGISMVASVAKEQFREGGDVILKQGDRGDGFYLIIEGEVRVTIADQEEIEVARLHAGGFFGEMSLLSDQPRSASVWAVGETTLLWFDCHEFAPILEAYPQIREVLSGVALKRTEDNLWRALFDDEEVRQRFDEIQEPDTHIEIDHQQDEVTTHIAATPNQEVVAPQTTLIQHENENAGTTEVTEPSLEALQPSVMPLGTHTQGPLRDMGLFTMGLILGIGIALLATWALNPEAVMLHTNIALPTIDVTPFQQNKQAKPNGAPPRQTAQDTAKAANGKENIEVEIELKTEVGPREDDAPGQPVLPPQSDQAAHQRDIMDEDPFHSAREAHTATDVAKRKAMRQKLMDAFKARAFGEAAEIGAALRLLFYIDWEAHFKIAEAQRRSGALDQALLSYMYFVRTFDNIYTDNAQYRASEILIAQGNGDDAKPMLRAIVQNKKSELQAAARKLLRNMP